MGWILLFGGSVFFLVVVLHDLNQRHHAILHNYPVIGHLRYLLERFGPELRQYIVTGNDEERPFSRDQRRWVYASSKNQNNLFGFGTDNDLEVAPNYLIIKHAVFPYPASHNDGQNSIPCAKVLGGPRGRRKAFRPNSVVNTSAMSFGSLSGKAVEAINKGAKIADCLQNTGEGGISPHHDHGGGLIWQVGTGYFGCRTPDGRFDLDELVRKCERYPVAAIEIKLSQGAKPGKGGVLPGAKVTREIADIRGVPIGETVYSPAGHSAFTDADSLLDFVERIAEASGLPVGIKSAVGKTDFFEELAALMEKGDRGIDFLTIDGGEGGTGAAPLAFADHVALPFKLGFSRVYRLFASRGLDERMVFIGAGRLGFPEQALFAMGMGCDMIAVAREAMMSIGCIQAQKCHTDHCPTGVATQDRRLQAALDPTLKSERFARYIQTLRGDMLQLTHAIGKVHPSLVTLEDFEILGDDFTSRSAREVFEYAPSWGVPGEADRARLLAPSP